MTQSVARLVGIIITSAVILLSASQLSAQAPTTLVNFNGTDGDAPFQSSLVQGFDGNFYGTTAYGGLQAQGTVFQVTPDETLNSLYSFCSNADCTDGSAPNSGVVLGVDGNFYGTTVSGGAYGAGTVFKITSTGGFTKLHDFCAQPLCSDGGSPVAGLTLGRDGDFYGTTTGVGQSYGTVFKITPYGEFTVLYSFCSLLHCADGAIPSTGVVLGTDGNFYGATSSYGEYGYGTIFQLTPSLLLTTLHSFCAKKNCTDGYGTATLLQDTSGNLYGTTSLGGKYPPYTFGTVFKMTHTGVFTTLHSFDQTDGSQPAGGLIQGSDSKIYGTTNEGSTYGRGSIFNMTLGGILTTLASFCSSADCGYNPHAALFQGTDGNFYSTTQDSVGGDGTVFVLANGLTAIVQLLPTSGAVGTPVTILGANLTGTTSITFGGKKATFTVVSDTEIQATVPTAAKTGSVIVKTPTGTLKSNVSFEVTN